MNNLIPFNAWSKQRIEEGKKICTSRHAKYTKDPRVYWISPPLPWWFIRTYLFQAEGAINPTELNVVIQDIYKRIVSENEMFYVHFGNFKETKT
jgi:hypothetical protein